MFDKEKFEKLIDNVVALVGNPQTNSELREPIKIVNFQASTLELMHAVLRGDKRKTRDYLDSFISACMRILIQIGFHQAPNSFGCKHGWGTVEKTELLRRIERAFELHSWDNYTVFDQTDALLEEAHEFVWAYNICSYESVKNELLDCMVVAMRIYMCNQEKDGE